MNNKMRLTLSRDPLTMMSRIQNAIADDDFLNVNWDDTQLDLYEEDSQVVVKLKAPGFDEKNIDISVEGNTLTITGNIEEVEEDQDKKKKFYRKEIRVQSFTRSINLPARIEVDKANAQFKKGILHLTLPKAAEALPKKISIKVTE